MSSGPELSLMRLHHIQSLMHLGSLLLLLLIHLPPGSLLSHLLTFLCHSLLPIKDLCLFVKSASHSRRRFNCLQKDFRNLNL